MSILLCTYWKDGIVFSADRNATIFYESEKGRIKYVDVGNSTKVMAWPRKRALLGFVGLGDLAGLGMDEWMRQFIDNTRDFDRIDTLAEELQNLMQKDFDKTYPNGVKIIDKHIIVRLGGFRRCEDVLVPVNYVITNIPGIPGLRSPKGIHPLATRKLTMTDQIAHFMEEEGAKYPFGVRDKIAEMEQSGGFLWFNNGAMWPAFNIFKHALWVASGMLRQTGFLERDITMEDRIAFSEMSVRVFGLFFEHHFPPEERAVGGGVDTVWMAWPE